MIADGKTIYACSTLAIEAQGKKIRTVESFTQGTVLHPVQQAFCDKDGLMCGFCTPGFVTATVALLEKTPNPTAEQAKRGARRQHLPLRHLRPRARSGAVERPAASALRWKEARRGRSARARGVGPHAQLNQGVARG